MTDDDELAGVLANITAIRLEIAKLERARRRSQRVMLAMYVIAVLWFVGLLAWSLRG